jgi:hypothetical protein
LVPFDPGLRCAAPTAWRPWLIPASRVAIHQPF